MSMIEMLYFFLSSGIWLGFPCVFQAEKELSICASGVFF